MWPQKKHIVQKRIKHLKTKTLSDRLTIKMCTLVSVQSYPVHSSGMINTCGKPNTKPNAVNILFSSVWEMFPFKKLTIDGGIKYT